MVCLVLKKADKSRQLDAYSIWSWPLTVTTFDMDIASESADQEYPLHIVKLYPLQEILRADLVLGGDTTHPLNHSLIITLQTMQIRSGWGTGYPSTEHIDLESLSFHAKLQRISFCCSSLCGSEIMPWGHLHRGFSRNVLYETFLGGILYCDE